MVEDAIADFASYSDEQLMGLYQQGEYKAFEEIYSRHSGRVFSYFKKRLYGTGEAEDLLQQTFLKIHQSRNRYDATYPLISWIFSIARNSLIDHTRKMKPTPMQEEKLLAIAEKNELQEKVDPITDWNEILKLLPETQKKLIQLRFEEGLSFEVIAKMNSTSEVSIRKRLSRTVQSLRLKLSRKGVKP
jgi:RNA polymerase sigma-70 factor (ECF subfamily)